jgi:ketosteroid isomerase-like protein
MQGSIRAEEVHAQVRQFWDALSKKSKERFASMYSSEATIMSSTARRPEMVRLMLARRMRQFFDPAISMKVEVGAVQVQIVGATTAIATYPYALHSTTTNRDGSQTSRDTPHARATQIFQRQEGGGLHIVHEHLSSGKQLAKT